MTCDGADISAAVHHQEFDDLGPGRFGDRLEHFRFKRFNQLVQLWGRILYHWDIHVTYISAPPCTCQGVQKNYTCREYCLVLFCYVSIQFNYNK